jgi:hypothetical protein
LRTITTRRTATRQLLPRPCVSAPLFFPLILLLTACATMQAQVGSASLNGRYTDLQGFGDNTLEGVNTLHLNPTTLLLNDSSANALPTTATVSPGSGFGSAPQKLGRRLVEISAKFNC